MGFSCGIIGLTRVGKTTIFNALTSANAQLHSFSSGADNPNIAVVHLPDPRLDDLGAVHKTKKITPTTLQFVDVAGLVRGSSEGGGMGNQFLAHVREADAIVHVVRCFESEEVIHAEGGLDPKRDTELIHMELALADLATVERRRERTLKLARSGDAEGKKIVAALEKVKEQLDEGRPAKAAGLHPEEIKLLDDLHLITFKPLFYVANIDEQGLQADHKHAAALEQVAREEGAECVRICGKIEAEMATLPEADRAEFMEAYGLKESGLSKLVHAGFKTLDLMTFLTAGEKETRAWTIPKGAKAPQAAGKIHSDLERGFIRLEVYSYDDWVACGRDEKKVKEKGLYRSEGKEYTMREGDVCLFRFNV